MPCEICHYKNCIQTYVGRNATTPFLMFPLVYEKFPHKGIIIPQLPLGDRNLGYFQFGSFSFSENHAVYNKYRLYFAPSCEGWVPFVKESGVLELGHFDTEYAFRGFSCRETITHASQVGYINITIAISVVHMRCLVFVFVLFCITSKWFKIEVENKNVLYWISVILIGSFKFQYKKEKTLREKINFFRR